MFAQIPNLLSLARIVMVPMVIVLLNEHNYAYAFMVFTLAGITDGLDGWIAKKFKWQSALGAVLDPLADKLLLISTYAMLAILGDIPFWLFILVIFRDFLIVGGYWVLIAIDKKVKIHPIWISKFNTFFQIVLVVLVLVHSADWIALENTISIVISIVVFTTITSGMSYIWSGFSQVLEGQ